MVLAKYIPEMYLAEHFAGEIYLTECDQCLGNACHQI